MMKWELGMLQSFLCRNSWLMVAVSLGLGKSILGVQNSILKGFGIGGVGFSVLSKPYHPNMV